MGNTQRGAELSKLDTHILRTIVRAKDFWDSMLWEHFLEEQDDFGGVVLARSKASGEDHLLVEVTTYEVVSSFQGEDSKVHICHGWDGVGVGVRGAAAFWAQNWVQASHWQTTSSMALFIPGQKICPHVTTRIW